MLTIRTQLNNLEYVKTQIQIQIQKTSINLYRVCLAESFLNPDEKIREKLKEQLID